MNGDFEKIEKWIDSLNAEEQIAATFYLLDKCRLYVPVEKIPRIFQCVRDFIKSYRIGRTHPEFGWSKKEGRPPKRAQKWPVTRKVI